MRRWTTQRTEAVACAAIEEFLAGRLEETLRSCRSARQADENATEVCRALEESCARDLTAWQESGFLSHLNAANVIEVYYARRVAQASRALRRQRRARRAHYERLRREHHRLREERVVVHAWLVDNGWDPELEHPPAEGVGEPAGHYRRPAGR